MKVAYFCEPQYGGTFSFFKRMRPRLAEQGIDFRCIPPFTAERFPGTPFEQEEGLDLVRFPEDDLPAASRALIEHLEQERYDAVLVLPGCDIICNNLVRYLPRKIRATARVPMITRGTYAPTKALAPSLNLVFGVSRRVADDLIKRYGLPAEKVRVIYNGADVPDVPSRRTFGRNGEPFRLFYSGRLTDMDKGVLLLPGILERVVKNGLNAQLTVSGDGPDGERLKAEFERRGLRDRVRMTGNIPLAEVDNLLAETDCFVLPSRFEGCPNALIEAMAAGCPSVSARILGSVDQIVEEGTSGLLADVADPVSFAQGIGELARDPERCARMSEAARSRIAEAFTLTHTADAYAEAFHLLTSMPDRREPARSLDRYDVPRAMLPTWRTRVPQPLKNLARKWLERFGISS